jgi:hypothetical protein
MVKLFEKHECGECFSKQFFTMLKTNVFSTLQFANHDRCFDLSSIDDRAAPIDDRAAVPMPTAH